MAKKLLSGALIVITIICGGCAKKACYKPKPIRPLKEHKQIDYQETQKNITLRAKLFTIEDRNEIFGDRANRLNTVMPLQISIENNSGATWYLSPKNIALQQETINTVARRLRSWHTLWWPLTALGGGLALTIGFGLPWLFWVGVPVCGSCHVDRFALCLVGIPTLIGMLAIYGSPIIFIIGLIADSYVNAALMPYLQETYLSKSTSIAPGTAVDQLIFVKNQHFKQQFDIMLTNGTTDEKLIFHVSLHKQCDAPKKR